MQDEEFLCRGKICGLQKTVVGGSSPEFIEIARPKAEVRVSNKRRVNGNPARLAYAHSCFVLLISRFIRIQLPSLIEQLTVRKVTNNRKPVHKNKVERHTQTGRIRARPLGSIFCNKPIQPCRLRRCIMDYWTPCSLSSQNREHTSLTYRKSRQRQLLAGRVPILSICNSALTIGRSAG